MAAMKEEEIRTILRTYFKERIDQKVGKARGSIKAFERLTEIKHPQISLALSGDGEVSWGMLAKISETIGPSMDSILNDLAKLVSKAQKDGARQAEADRLAIMCVRLPKRSVPRRHRATVQGLLVKNYERPPNRRRNACKLRAPSIHNRLLQLLQKRRTRKADHLVGAHLNRRRARRF